MNGALYSRPILLLLGLSFLIAVAAVWFLLRGVSTDEFSVECRGQYFDGKPFPGTMEGSFWMYFPERSFTSHLLNAGNAFIGEDLVGHSYTFEVVGIQNRKIIAVEYHEPDATGSNGGLNEYLNERDVRNNPSKLEVSRLSGHISADLKNRRFGERTFKGQCELSESFQKYP